MIIRTVAASLFAGLIAVSVPAIVPSPVLAQTETANAQALFDVMDLATVVEIMRLEGLAYGDQIAADLFAGQTPPEWGAQVAAIYDLDRMTSQALDALTQATAGQDLAPAIAFFSTPAGQSYIALEVSARRALLDEDVETAAKEAAAIAMADQTARVEQINRFVAANDLIETNVVGAMNSSFAFYRGLMQGGAFPPDMTEAQMLADVWAQEPDIRQRTTEWVYSFLLMAYSPLSDDELESYIAFSQTPEGRSLNRVVFDAFDGMFEEISLSLGRAAARYMSGQDL